MFEGTVSATLPKAEFYDELAMQARSLFAGESNRIANAANLSALLFNSMPDLNWAGFYFLTEGELVVGPFQGKPACVRIAIGRGVCGRAAETRETQVVPDVHAFPGHIACDAASRSELVLPVVVDGRLRAVFDLDSPAPARFDAIDSEGFQRAVAALVAGTDWA
jgi:GAF domain-containing protein